ncbi:MAG: hypothetical protein BGO78_16565 [Chloroflexi bacterium 44-23]|nr:MAG: hypothetical protein BGO78_16565 [Chloroflexi bacterium 44-23]
MNDMKRCPNPNIPTQRNSLRPFIVLGAIYGVLTSLFVIFMLKSKRRGVQLSTSTTLTYIPLETELIADTSLDQALIVQDDLTKISGIGPVISNYLKANGILTFKQLSKLSVNQIKELLAQKQYRLQDPETWPQQAQLAAEKNWEALAKLQKK